MEDCSKKLVHVIKARIVWEIEELERKLTEGARQCSSCNNCVVDSKQTRIDTRNNKCIYLVMMKV